MFIYSLNVSKAILKSVVASVHLSVWCHIFIGIPNVEFIQIIFCESMVKLIILPTKNALYWNGIICHSWEHSTIVSAI